MKKQLNFLVATAVGILFMSSCASLTGFEEGRTLDKDNSELIVSANFTRVPDLFDDDDFQELDSINTSISFPNIEVSFKRGITEKLDVGIRASSNLNLSAFVKYQVVGDQSTPFALSPGLEIGTILGAAFNIGIPIYTTYYPAENVAVNLTPRFMYQSITGGQSSGATYLGGNFGLLFGKKNKIGLDIGYYSVDTQVVGESGGTQPLFTFGIGGKFRFGDY